MPDLIMAGTPKGSGYKTLTRMGFTRLIVLQHTLLLIQVPIIIFMNELTFGSPCAIASHTRASFEFL